MEIDLDYEFEAAQFFDFTREETKEEVYEAELWLETATAYPPSPVVAEMFSMGKFFPENVNVSSKLKCTDDQVHDQQDDTFKGVGTPPIRVTNDKGIVKRKRRQSAGFFKFEEHLAHRRQNINKIVAFFQKEVSYKEKEEEKAVKRVLEILNRMVENNLVKEGTLLWCYIISKTKSRNDMNMILKLANDNQRINWLKWEFENR